jgi:hypothetical protein
MGSPDFFFTHILFALNLQNLSFFGRKLYFFVKVFQDRAFEDEPQVLDFATQNLGSRGTQANYTGEGLSRKSEKTS